jgi:geranylgeranyl diphosphate synthase type II
MSNTLQTTWRKLATRVEAALDRFVPTATTPPRELHKAMRYSLFAGGKRLRPVLCLMAAKLIGGRIDRAMAPACALEMVHTYSLIHDDLPAMDDDDLRRGKPTLHKVAGEAVAILAGDALLTLAFETIAGRLRDGALAGTLTRELARASGTVGMVGGQVFDMLGEGKKPSAELVEEIHMKKTAALIRASVRMGAMAVGASAAQLRDLTRYGEAVGLLFQITDDLLDEEGEAIRMGKRLRKDAARGKQTYPRAYGIERSRAFAEKLGRRAERAIAKYGNAAKTLSAVPGYVLARTH